MTADTTDITALARKAVEARKMYENSDRSLNDQFFAWRRAVEEFHENCSAVSVINMAERLEKAEAALRFYSNSKHWNDDGQCMTPDEYPAPMWAETDEPIVGGKLDLGETAKLALKPKEPSHG